MFEWVLENLQGCRQVLAAQYPCGNLCEGISVKKPLGIAPISRCSQS